MTTPLRHLGGRERRVLMDPGHTRLVATVTPTVVERYGPAIRLARAEHAPQESPRFEAEPRGALNRAAEDVDATGIAIGADPLARPGDDSREPADRAGAALVQRAPAGDFTGLRARDEHGD